tara:strand:+ start:812 stop:1591 length:780 start_codon:yes stop_codon:yes gene_type:complete
MTQLILEIEQSLEANASRYFDKAKKIRRKKEGALEALAATEKKLKQLEKSLVKEIQDLALEEERKARTLEWYEKFRWFRTSEGFFVLGGRDATSNEIVVKKHTTSADLIFHTDIAGSPFFVLQTEGKKVGEVSKKEVAIATASFSRAWKMGVASTPVFYVNSEQVSKKALAGEYLVKGAFMVYGKKTYVDNALGCALGSFDGKLMAGPLSAVKKHCSSFIEIVQGREKPSKVAKLVQKKLGFTIDEIIRALPTGGVGVK